MKPFIPPDALVAAVATEAEPQVLEVCPAGIDKTTHNTAPIAKVQPVPIEQTRPAKAIIAPAKAAHFNAKVQKDANFAIIAPHQHVAAYFGAPHGLYKSKAEAEAETPFYSPYVYNGLKAYNGFNGYSGYPVSNGLNAYTGIAYQAPKVKFTKVEPVTNTLPIPPAALHAATAI